MPGEATVSAYADSVRSFSTAVDRMQGALSDVEALCARRVVAYIAAHAEPHTTDAMRLYMGVCGYMLHKLGRWPSPLERIVWLKACHEFQRAAEKQERAA